MVNQHEDLQRDINEFHQNVLTDPIGILDPPGVIHHEFADGHHGRKLDFDKISSEDELYIQWVDLYAQYIKSRYRTRTAMPDALVGVANGANRLSRDIPSHFDGRLGKKVLSLFTVKTTSGDMRITDDSIAILDSKRVKFALIVEDVSTTGSTTAKVVDRLRELGQRRIEVVSTWQRSFSLPHLENKNVRHGAMIYHPMPMFAPEECRTSPEGYCARGIELEVHSRNS